MARKRIKYAFGGDADVGEGMLRPGAKVPWAESEDNPMSPNFVPLTDRGEKSIARFWAMHAQRSRNTEDSHGVYDE